MNNQMIGKCRYCGQDYCMECSEHKHWEEFCSDNCYDEYCGEPGTDPIPANKTR